MRPCMIPIQVAKMVPAIRDQREHLEVTVRRATVLLFVLAGGLFVSLRSATGAEGRWETSARGEHGVAVSVSPEATEVGIEVLRAGGNAVDAAVAMAFALAVTFPAAGNIGGGGFMMVYDPMSAQVYTVEYRETAPARATYETLSGVTARSRGHKTVGVPGTVAGLELAHRRFGQLPWKRLVEPAIRLAREGITVREALADSLNGILRHPAVTDEMRRVYGNGGRPWRPGDRLVQPDLARTLELIAEHGADAFYRGPIARMIVREMELGGGILDLEDLQNYRAYLRPPVRVSYRGYEVFGPPPPSSGGVVLGEMLNVLSHFDLQKWQRWSPQTIHVMVETMKRAYLDRARYLGDPDYVEVPVRRLLSQEHAARLARSISLARATPAVELGRDILSDNEGQHTTHFAVADHSGFAVSNTYTLQDSYGSLVVVRGGGFLLNNEMTDFNWTPGRTDTEGNIGTPPNALQPGKRMLSSQTPVIVLKNRRPYLLTGSPGGRTIINTSLQVTLNVLTFKMSLRAAVDAPRVHHQWMPDVLVYEQAPELESIRGELEELGHRLRPVRRIGDAHSLLIDGGFVGEADRRIEGAAAAY